MLESWYRTVCVHVCVTWCCGRIWSLSLCRYCILKCHYTYTVLQHCAYSSVSWINTRLLRISRGDRHNVCSKSHVSNRQEWVIWNNCILYRFKQVFKISHLISLVTYLCFPVVYWVFYMLLHSNRNSITLHLSLALSCSLPWSQTFRCLILFTGMRSHGTSPIRPSFCKMDWSEQADGTWPRGCAASTGAIRNWAVGLSCPPPSPFSSQSTRPSTTKMHYAGSTTSTVDTLNAG